MPQHCMQQAQEITPYREEITNQRKSSILGKNPIWKCKRTAKPGNVGRILEAVSNAINLLNLTVHGAIDRVEWKKGFV